MKQVKIALYNDHFASTTTPVLFPELPTIHNLEAETSLNEIGTMRFVVKQTDPRAENIAYGQRCELHYKEDELSSWTKDWTGIITDDGGEGLGNKWRTITAKTPEWLLSRRICGYPAGTLGLSLFQSTPIDTILYYLIGYNMTGFATTANGRYRSVYGAPTSYFQWKGSAPGGTMTAITLACHGQSLLTIIQQLANKHQFDFQVEPIETAGGYQFALYPTGKGSDKTTSVKFSEGIGNIQEPEYQYNRTEEKTVAITVGKGEKDYRPFVICTGPDYASSNDAEMYINAASAGADNDAIEQMGQSIINTHKASKRLTFTPRLIGKYRYGTDYEIGDTVSALYNGDEHQPRIVKSAWKKTEKNIIHNILADSSPIFGTTPAGGGIYNETPAISGTLFAEMTCNSGDAAQFLKIASHPATGTGTGDNIRIEFFGGYVASNNQFRGIIRAGNRNAFNAYIEWISGDTTQLTHARLRAYTSSGVTSWYLYLPGTTWAFIAANVQMTGWGTKPTLYPGKIPSTSTPSGSLAFDSYTATIPLILSNTSDIYTTPLTDYSATSTVTGWSSFTNKQILYKRLGNLYFIWFNIAGTSNSTSTRFTVPVTVTTNFLIHRPIFRGVDNGTPTVAYARIPNGTLPGNILDFFTIAGASFQNTGTKSIEGQLILDAS